jgi:hypothetical protein
MMRFFTLDQKCTMLPALFWWFCDKETDYNYVQIDL